MLKLADHWVWDSWYATDDDGRHHVFFLRASRALQEEGRRHHRASIGHAVSDDLAEWTLLPDALVFADAPAWDDQATWHRLPGPQVEADPRFYELLTEDSGFDQACRDPWVFRNPGGDGWHMTFTARVAGPEPARERGVVGHARSTDLDAWEVL